MSLFKEWPTIDEMEEFYSSVMNKGLSVLLNSNYYSVGCLYWDRGCARRLRAIIRCLSNVFTFIPYNKEREYKNLDFGLIEDINIYFNSFIVLIHGYLDDLAFMIETKLPDKAKHKNPKYISIQNIKWEKTDSSYKELQKEVKDYLDKSNGNKLIRDRSVHRFFPYFVSVVDSEDEYNCNHELAIKYLMNKDFEKYEYYSNLSEQLIHYNGFVMSDSIEPEEQSVLINSIHCCMVDALDELLDFTIKVFSILFRAQYKNSYSRDPHLINYNWRRT